MKQEKVGYLSAKGKTIYIFRGEDAILFLTMSPNAVGKLNWQKKIYAIIYWYNLKKELFGTVPQTYPIPPKSYIVGPWVYICKYYIWYIVYVYITDMH